MIFFNPLALLGAACIATTVLAQQPSFYVSNYTTYGSGCPGLDSVAVHPDGLANISVSFRDPFKVFLGPEFQIPDRLRECALEFEFGRLPIGHRMALTWVRYGGYLDLRSTTFRAQTNVTVAYAETGNQGLGGINLLPDWGRDDAFAESFDVREPNPNLVYGDCITEKDTPATMLVSTRVGLWDEGDDAEARGELGVQGGGSMFLTVNLSWQKC